MKTKLFSLLLIVVVFLSTNINAQTWQELVAAGDQLTDQFNDMGALEKYAAADKLDKDNWEIQWRLSRSYTNIGAHMPVETSEQEDAQLNTYETAMKYADSAVKLQPNKTETLIRRAIANGRIALFKGVFSVGEIVTAVKDDAEKAIKNNSGSVYELALSHYVLGRTHAKLSEKWKPALSVLGMGWADINIAISHFQKAIELYPGYVMFYYDYAKALMTEDRYEEAKAALEKALTCKIQDQDDHIKLKEIPEMLKEVNDEL